MKTPVDRFKKRRTVLEGKTIPNMPHQAPAPSALIEVASHSFVAVRFNDEAELISAEADTLLAEIHGRIDDEKFSALIDACQKECLQAVIRPFGIGQILFEDKLGGNVATIHNVRLEEYQKSDNTAWATTGERIKYESRDDYNYADYHDKNKDFAKKKKEVQSGYDLDHSLPCLKIHNDAGIYLADLKGSDIANMPENHNALSSYYNRAKGSRGAKEFVDRLPELEVKRANAIKAVEFSIHDLEQNQNRTEQQNKDLANKKKALSLMRDAHPIDPSKLFEDEARAKEAINKKINETYYTGGKFLKNAAITSLNEGGRMALQQAIGVLMEEFIRAAFAEVKDAWKNGFKGSMDDAFLDALKVRLMRVALRVQSKWKGAVSAAISGGISGFMSNLVTVIINMFTTTEEQVGRMLREGFMSLYRALKILAFPPEGWSLAQAADASSKLFASGLVTGAGIGIQVVFEAKLIALGPLAPYVSSIAAGLVTGLGTAFIVYMLDQFDLFGANAQSRHEHVVAKLNSMISISYKRAEEAASMFDGPTLLHLT